MADSLYQQVSSSASELRSSRCTQQLKPKSEKKIQVLSAKLAGLVLSLTSRVEKRGKARGRSHLHRASNVSGDRRRLPASSRPFEKDEPRQERSY